MYGTEIIEKTKLGTFLNVDSEDMVMNFLSNVELNHTKMSSLTFLIMKKNVCIYLYIKYS